MTAVALTVRRESCWRRGRRFKLTCRDIGNALSARHARSPTATVGTALAQYAGAVAKYFLTALLQQRCLRYEQRPVWRSSRFTGTEASVHQRNVGRVQRPT
ncbi:hypothetical protein KCP70_01375 [Salmonella enterica subsp. enterica]|nr:hypothetical protein KCP70_01375 [Salmonella enterica subsp. enterica]